jgi:hypothetical protein
MGLVEETRELVVVGLPYVVGIASRRTILRWSRFLASITGHRIEPKTNSRRIETAPLSLTNP